MSASNPRSVTATSDTGIFMLIVGAIALAVVALLSIAEDVTERKLAVSGTLILMLIVGAIGLAATAAAAKQQRR